MRKILDATVILAGLAIVFNLWFPHEPLDAAAKAFLTISVIITVWNWCHIKIDTSDEKGNEG